MILENVNLEEHDDENVEFHNVTDNLIQKEREHLTSIIIPLYNEQNSIIDLIKRIPNHNFYEIVIVNDGSTDNSVKKIREITNRDIKIIHHKHNQGYGAAILTGFKHATGDVIITMDSDGQHNPEEVPSLIEPIIKDQADFVVGSRYLGKFNYKNPLYARVGTYIIKVIFRMLFLQKVRDNQSGFRAFKKENITIFKNTQNKGMGFSTELLFRAGFNKFRILETPISANPRLYGTSKINLFKIIRSVSSCMLYYVLRKLETHFSRFFIGNTLLFFYRKVKRNLKYNQQMIFEDLFLRGSHNVKLKQGFSEIGNRTSLKEEYKGFDVLDLEKPLPKIIITIPAYNEEKSIGRVIQEIKFFMDKTNWDYEILVLDDGSQDNTSEISIREGAIVISNKVNLGLANTFRREMEICGSLGADIIVHTDADGQYPSRYIPLMIEKILNGYDLVLGSRFGNGTYGGTLGKKVGNLFFARLLSLMLRKNIHDTTTGFRAFTKEIAQLPIKSNFTYTQEQLIRVIRLKKKVGEVAIQGRKTRESKLFSNILEYFYRAALTLLKILRN